MYTPAESAFYSDTISAGRVELLKSITQQIMLRLQQFLEGGKQSDLIEAVNAFERIGPELEHVLVNASTNLGQSAMGSWIGEADAIYNNQWIIESLLRTVAHTLESGKYESPTSSVTYTIAEDGKIAVSTEELYKEFQQQTLSYELLENTTVILEQMDNTSFVERIHSLVTDPTVQATPSYNSAHVFTKTD